jgi:hypothetical protein
LSSRPVSTHAPSREVRKLIRGRHGKPCGPRLAGAGAGAEVRFRRRPPADPVAPGLGDKPEDDPEGAEDEGADDQGEAEGGHPAADESGDAEPTAAPLGNGRRVAGVLLGGDGVGLMARAPQPQDSRERRAARPGPRSCRSTERSSAASPRPPSLCDSSPTIAIRPGRAWHATASRLALPSGIDRRCGGVVSPSSYFF